MLLESEVFRPRKQVPYLRHRSCEVCGNGKLSGPRVGREWPLVGMLGRSWGGSTATPFVEKCRNKFAITGNRQNRYSFYDFMPGIYAFPVFQIRSSEFWESTKAPGQRGHISTSFPVLTRAAAEGTTSRGVQSALDLYSGLRGLQSGVHAKLRGRSPCGVSRGRSVPAAQRDSAGDLKSTENRHFR
jgi:hypothetical protein